MPTENETRLMRSWGWAAAVTISVIAICMAAYNIAELYFTHIAQSNKTSK